MPPFERPKRWTLVLDVAGGPTQTFIVRPKQRQDVDEVMVAIRSELRNLCERGGCRSVVIGIHVEGPECDHEVGAR